jgi:hypothetical protein
MLTGCKTPDDLRRMDSSETVPGARFRPLTAIVGSIPLLILPPLLGIRLAGKPIAPYCEFPPLTRYVQHAGFSWFGFSILAIAATATMISILFHIVRRRSAIRGSFSPLAPLPWWGWTGLALGAAAWILAWTRFPWFASFQHFTFSPFWFAYVLALNALTFRRSGRCLLKDRPLYLLALFPFSAAFWWFFEYLNRFVQNWHYVGIEQLTPLRYFAMATLPFSTVLPAVMSTYEWLEARCGPASEPMSRHTCGTPKLAAWLVLLFACAGLAGIGLQPDLLFPLLWIAPLLVVSSLQVIRGYPSLLFKMERGNRHRICLLALAALICGFFWEMLNYFSLAKWVYTIPYVNRFRIFEMPILGYAGYLSFGLECGVIANIVETMVYRGRLVGEQRA